MSVGESYYSDKGSGLRSGWGGLEEEDRDGRRINKMEIKRE